MKLQEIIQNVTARTSLSLYDFNRNTADWESWYKGKVSSFHNYRIWNGKNNVYCERQSLQLAKKICEDWANLLINEKTDITLADENSQRMLEKILADTRFWVKANEGVEKTFAIGEGAWVVQVNGLTIGEDGHNKDGKVNVVFCNRKKIRPLTVVDDVITECAFVNERTIASSNEKEYSVQVHVKNEVGNYVIYNFVARGQNENAITLAGDKAVYKFDTQSDTPWFVMLKPYIANNSDFNSPFGISIFANAIDTLKQIDLVFDSYANEFILGRKRLFVKMSQLAIDPMTGEQFNPFDANDISVYNLPDGEEDINKRIMDNTQVLRVNDHQLALQNALDILSYQCGFGTEHYKFTHKGGVATATQVISENSEMFRNVKKQEILVEECLTALVKAIAYASNTFTANDYINAESITIKFDDSIIEDKATERATDLADVAQGIMSKAEYRSKWYAEDEETARAKIDEIGETTITDFDLLDFNGRTQVD